jgi:hypothetical protein
MSGQIPIEPLIRVLSSEATDQRTAGPPPGNRCRCPSLGLHLYNWICVSAEIEIFDFAEFARIRPIKIGWMRAVKDHPDPARD